MYYEDAFGEIDYNEGMYDFYSDDVDNSCVTFDDGTEECGNLDDYGMIGLTTDFDYNLFMYTSDSISNADLESTLCLYAGCSALNSECEVWEEWGEFIAYCICDEGYFGKTCS